MSFLILIAVLLGAVWGSLLVSRGSILLGCVAYLVLAACFGPYFWSVDVAGITLTLDRLFLVGLVAAFVMRWRAGRVETKPLIACDWLLLAFVGWITLSAFTHDWRLMTVGDVPVIQHLINGYYIPVTIYFLARNVRLDEQSGASVQIALAVFGVYLAAIGLLEAAGQWSLVFPRYIADPGLGLHFGRSRGPMVHSVSYGMYVAACLLCLWFWREKVAGRTRTLLLLLVPVFLAAVFFTKTRTVWLGAGTAILITLGATLHGRARNLLLASLLAGAAIVAIAKMDAILGLQREGTVADTRQSASMRTSFTYVSWRMFQDRPLLGFGFGQFASAKLPYLTDRSVDLQLETIRTYVHHNTFLAILTETGLVGLCLFLAVLLRWAHDAWRLLRDSDASPWRRRQSLLFLGVLAIAFWQMIGHEITFTPLDMSLLLLTAGMAVSAAQTHVVMSHIGIRREWRPAAHSLGGWQP